MACGLFACASLAQEKTPQRYAEAGGAFLTSSQTEVLSADATNAKRDTPINVRVCVAMATGVPCNPLASIYSDASLASPKAPADMGATVGSYPFYAKPGMYIVQVSALGSYQNVPVAIPPTRSSTAHEARIAVQRNSDGSFSVSLSGSIITRESAAGAMAGPVSGSATSQTFRPTPPIIIRPQPKPTPQPPAPDPSPSSSNPPALEPPSGSPIQYVAYTGNDGNDGLSWGTAKATIMAAYDALPPYGGTIYIMQGPGDVPTTVPSTSTPGQGIWIMGGGDPNYDSPPPGWRRFKPNVDFIGVGGMSAQANSHDGGQVEISGGTSRNQPCIWLSSLSGPLLFQNLKCAYPGRAVVIGETSNNLRSGLGSVQGVTFNNVAGEVAGTAGSGPGVDITGASFWLYFNDCVFAGNYQTQTPSVLDNQHAAMLIDGTGNPGNYLIFVSNLNTTGGGIKFIPGSGYGSLTVNGMTEEGTGNGLDIPPAVYVTYTDNYTTFDFENITVADPGPSGAEAVLVGGNGPPGAVVASGTLSSSGTLPPVVGPATVISEYPNLVANSPQTPAQMGQVGFFNGYVVGQTDVARRLFGPVAIRFPNLASQIPSQWQAQPAITITAGILAPDGTSNAGRAVDGAQQRANVYYYFHDMTVGLGDYFIGGVWLRSLASDGTFSGSPTTDANFDGHGTFSMSGSAHGAVSAGGGQWSWQWFIYKVTSVPDTPTYPEFWSNVDPDHSLEAYAPVLIHLPSGTVSDPEAYEIATNLASYPDGLPSGTVATLRGQQFAFGGTGNFFGVLTQSNTANRTYSFPDASGTVALTNIPQNWTAPQTLDSPVLSDPTIDGQKLDAPPMATFSAFLPGALSASYTASSFTPEYGIVITRVEVTLKTPSAGCSASAVISLQGSNSFDLPIPLEITDSGPISIQMNAGTPIQTVLSTPAQACSTPPQDANVTVHYRMQ